MKITNFEFKVKVKNLDKLEQKLLELHPVPGGVDHQIDTYYNVSKGRLKLREGNIENALIQYDRENIAGARQSDIVLYKHQPHSSLKEILFNLFGIKAIVEKKRKIYFIHNVKFHFDTVVGLGTFMEVEAIDKTGQSGIERLKEQCSEYFSFFKLDNADLVDCSYSDLLDE